MNQNTRVTLCAVIIAEVMGSFVAFLPSAQRSLHTFNGNCFDFVQRSNHRRCPSPCSPLFAFPTPTDSFTIAYNQKYLTQTLGVSEAKMEKLSRNLYNIVTLEVGVLDERADWLTERLGLTKNEMKKIAQSRPSLLRSRPHENLAPKLDYLQTRLLLDDASLRKIILACPRVLDYSIKDNVEPKLDWLQQRLDLDDTAVGKMIQRNPALLSYSVEDNIEPKLEWLQQRLDLDEAKVSKMIQRLPAFFCYSVEDNLEPKLEWSRQRLGLKDAAAAEILRRCHSIFSQSVENMEPKLEWLQQRLDLDDAALSNMIQQFPTFFNCNVDTNLKPTLDFYIDALGEKQALALVVDRPSLFSYSLEKRLKPRLEDAREAGIVIDSACLKRIAKCTNEEWSKSLDFQVK